MLNAVKHDVLVWLSDFLNSFIKNSSLTSTSLVTFNSQFFIFN